MTVSRATLRSSDTAGSQFVTRADVMVRGLTWLTVCVLGLSACQRFGYSEHPAPDAGKLHPADAAVPRDAAADASAPTDAATSTPDAGTPIDAEISTPDSGAATDAAVSKPDSGAETDAGLSTPDASEPPPDAAGTDDDDAGPSCTPSAARDYCTRLPALPQAPQLDGVLDCGPSLVDLPATGWNSPLALPSDNHARYAAAWRPDGLYFYVEVDDMLLLPALASHVDPWCGDGVELYADADGQFVAAPDYDDPGAIQLLATAPSRTPGTALAVDACYHTRSEARAGNWAATRHVVVPRENGYALEAFVTAAELELNSWTLAKGGKVGLDIAINVSVTDATQKVGCGYILGQYYLRVSRTPCTTDSCRPHTSAAAFCTALLE